MKKKMIVGIVRHNCFNFDSICITKAIYTMGKGIIKRLALYNQETPVANFYILLNKLVIGWRLKDESL